jgi:hypothetical protein
MLDQGNPCGGLGWQNWSKSGVGMRLPKRNPRFLHTLLNPGMGDAMGESEIRSRGERPGFDYGQNVWRRSSARFPLGRARTPAFGHLA